MHLCSICRKSCSCGGDSTSVTSLREPDHCTCCIGQCEHGVEFGLFCAECELEGFSPDPDAATPPAHPSMNGGW